MIGHPSGAQFEIMIDGKPRAYCARKVVAIHAAEYLKQREPCSAVVVNDLQSREMTVVDVRAGPRAPLMPLHVAFDRLQSTKGPQGLHNLASG